MATTRQNNVDQALRQEGVRETVPYRPGTDEETIDILWLSRLRPKMRQRVLSVYGPTLADVEENLGVYIYYDTHQPEIVDTEELIDHAQTPEALEALQAILAEEGTHEDKYHRVYDVLFGARRVTYTQLADVVEVLRQEWDVLVPNKMSWYFRFGGYLNFIEEHLQWLRDRALGRDLPEGEDVLLVEPPIQAIDTQQLEASY